MRLLASPDPNVLCHAADALANLALQNTGAQHQLSISRCPVVMPSSEGAGGEGAESGSVMVTREVGRAAVGGQGGSQNEPATTGPQQQQQQQQQRVSAFGGVAALVRLLGTGHVGLMAKTLRALSNAVMGCPPNQQALLQTGGSLGLLFTVVYCSHIRHIK